MSQSTPAPLDERVVQTLRFINTFCEANGYSPRFIDIKNELGISTSTAHRHVQKLIKQGMVEWRRGPVLTDAGRAYIASLEQPS